MKKRTLIAVAATLAIAMSVGCANATNITGATKSGSTYTVKPQDINGNVGYRKYDNFNLSKGDVANMDFRGTKIQGGKEVTKDVKSFINLVGNKVQIDGVLNSTKNGSFYNGNAIFITPGGFAVGSSGVVNVGQLHVATPSTANYNKLIKNYGTTEGFKAINNVSKIKQDSNADVVVNGKIFAKDGIDLRGENVTIGGNLINGVASSKVLDADKAETLFNSLVGTDGKINNSRAFEKNSSIVLIKAQKSGGITTGANSTITNGTEQGVFLTNDGKGGTIVNGAIYDAQNVRVYNKKGDLSINNNANINSSLVEISNKGGALTSAGSSQLAGNRVHVINAGNGEMAVAGNITASEAIAVKNKTGANMTVGGKLEGTAKDTTIAINNYKGDLVLNGEIDNRGSKATTVAYNREGRGGLAVSKNANIDTANYTYFYNNGDNGMAVVGDIKNDGDMYFVNKNGNMKFTSDSKGEKSANVSNENGLLYILSKDNSKGFYEGAEAVISSKNGELAIKNKGEKVAKGGNGMELQGTVSQTNGTTAINNYTGNMKVIGTVSVDNGNLGIINREGAEDFTIASTSKINLDRANANIKNNANSEMNFNGEITHNRRVNVIANDGTMNLAGTVNNNSGALGTDGGFYAVSRYDAKGVNVTKDFNGQGKGEFVIKNINGSNGFDYNGSINSNGYQVTLVNKTGDLNLNGSLEAKNAPVMIKNGGRGIDISSRTDIVSGTKGTIYNYGTNPVSQSSSARLDNIEIIDKAN